MFTGKVKTTGLDNSGLDKNLALLNVMLKAKTGNCFYVTFSSGVKHF